MAQRVVGGLRIGDALAAWITANSQQPTAQQAMQAPRRSSLAVDVADPAGALLPCLCGHAHCAFA
ncbi:hypothetical protein CAI18_07280 [Xanthomonas citri pv. punicae]|nr:hypothetical protein CAI14_13905 [Xanthomonas citri pv. punicae]CCF66744.1 hypothetical protein XAPC_435 [Xanthomonas citri pv. punicae str. LMG 859]QCZ69221.1 hypothetical protein CAI17_11535 [Xanthomonas citri pv. punicae]QCZ76314.1 hypothetical protein XapA_05250 [Xanthomonas citri pv. punicae]QCZ81001.1 hypothetical protein XapB_08730 [Xanthomonas citri pv. punicae]